MIYSDCFSLSPIRGAYQNKGFAGSEAPRPPDGRPLTPGRRPPSRQQSHPPAEGSPNWRQPHPVPEAPAGRRPPPSRKQSHPPAEGSPNWRLPRPVPEANQAPTGAHSPGRRLESPNLWRGHGVESLGGGRPTDAGPSRRRQPHPVPEATQAGDSPTRRSPKPVNKKNRGCPQAVPVFIFIQDLFPS